MAGVSKLVKNWKGGYSWLICTDYMTHLYRMKTCLWRATLNESWDPAWFRQKWKAVS